MAHHHHRHYDTQDYAGDRAEQTHRTMRHMPPEDRVDRTDLQNSITGSQAKELTPEVRMGDDRALGDTPNWDGFDSEQLYNFATQQNSPSTADNLGRSFNTGGNSLADAANGLLGAVQRLDGAWSGDAADSARTALEPLARAAGNAGQTAQMMGVQMSRQSLAASEVRKLPPASKFDQQQSLTAMLAGGPAAMQADLKAQKDAADAVKREQIAHLSAYTKAMSSVDAQTPSFVPPPKGIKPGTGGDAKIHGSRVPFSARTRDADQGTSTGAPSGGFSGADPNGGFGANPDGSDGGDFALPGSLPGTSTAGFSPAASTAPVSGPGLGAGAAPHAAPSAGAGGFGGAFGNFGAGAGGAAAGAGAGSGGAGAAGEGARGGAAGARGPMPTGLAGRGAAGRGGAGMGAGGGRRQGEDDDEHERPAFLIEGDPEGTFGSDQLAAPPVIGGAEDE